MGCAQTAAEGDPIAVIVFLSFFLSSRVCQVVDLLSLSPSLKGLLLDGLAPRPRGRANFDDQDGPIMRQAWPSRPGLGKIHVFPGPGA